MKGIILAAGSGTRLRPLTNVIEKSLLPVGRYPMILRSIYKLKHAGITDILVVINRRSSITNLLGDGEGFGVEITYKVQNEPLGVAHALSLAEHFCAGDNCIVLLADNIFEDELAPYINSYKGYGAKVLLKEVTDPQRFGVDPQRFGVVELKDGKIISIEEKPAVPKSNLVTTGVYIYDKQVFDIIRTLQPSIRGEYEITDVNKVYLAEGTLDCDIFEGWWIDAGTFDSLHLANILCKDLDYHGKCR